MSIEPLTFRLIPVTRVDGKLVPIRELPLELKIIGVIAPPAVLALGKRWASIESHLIQLGLFGEEETKDWLMGHGKTFYDWLRESLGTRV
ncbi:hypothetical protein MUO93_06790 [Candidatus Bathyarchaeota archaeon]|nr:hypothetical protein [Candidatus Bathyarchaeota archaeon]